jgi:hypothetical protein
MMQQLWLGAIGIRFNPTSSAEGLTALAKAMMSAVSAG